MHSGSHATAGVGSHRQAATVPSGARDLYWPMALWRMAVTLWILIGALGWGGAQARPSHTQPADVAALRARQDLGAETLLQQALQARQAATEGLRQGWLDLALAELLNDLERADEALPRLDAAVAVARSEGADDLLFETLRRRGVILVNRGRTTETAAILAEMQALLDRNGGALPWRAVLLHDRGVLERKLGRFDAALAQFEQALALWRQVGDHEGIANELNSIGMLHGRTGRFSDAVLAHNEALGLARGLGDRGEIARSLRLLGILYRNLNDEELGSRYLLEALEHVEERNRREAIALYGELGKSLMLMDRLDEARQHAERAVTLAEASGSPPNKVNAYTRMAELELQAGQLDLARQWVERAFESFDSVAIRDQTLLKLTRVRVWAALGEAGPALVEAEATLRDTRRMGDRILERATLDVLSELQLTQGQAAAAFSTRKTYQQLDKELAMDVAARRIALLESSLDRQRLDAERALLERDHEIQTLTVRRQRAVGWVLVISVLALALVVATLVWRNREVRRSHAALHASRDELARVHQALLRNAEELERAAWTDALTGLPNRRASTRELESRWQTRTHPGGLFLLLIDVDHFKQVNDRHGHLAGDAVLCELARRMRGALPEAAFLGRFGGEEFIAILAGVGAEDAQRAAEALRQVIRDTPVALAAGDLQVTVSIGVAAAIHRQSAIDHLIHAADEALYAAKRSGRDRVVTHASEPT